MQVKVYIDRKIDKEGRSFLYFHFTGNGPKQKTSSKVKTKPEAWDGDQIKNGKLEPKGDIKNAIISAKLDIIKKIIAEHSIKLIDLSPTQLKNLYLQKVKSIESKALIKVNEGILPPEENPNSITYLIKSIQEGEKKETLSRETLRKYDQVKTHLNTFKEGVKIQDIDKKFLNSYCSYLILNDLENSTIKYNHLKCIKQIAEEARTQGIKIAKDIDEFTWKAQDKTPFAASWDEVSQIEKNTFFTNERHKIIRDAFIIACHTGLRESDLRFSREQLFMQQKQLMLHVVIQKTGWDYHIPLSKKVQTILERYDYKIPVFSQQFFNESLKTIARFSKVKGSSLKYRFVGPNKHAVELERWKLFSSHTARRTFGRRWLDMGGSLIILSKIFGHKNTDTTLKYIGYQPAEVIIEYNKAFGM